jgi:hypothetical protein
MNYINFEKEQLPSEKELFHCIIKTKNADLQQVEDLKQFLFDCTNAFIDAVDAYAKIEYREEPEILADNLLVLHSYNAALLGLTDSLFRKVKSRTYINLLAPKEAPEAKLTETGREYIAREAATDLEGMVRMLDEKQRNLLERIQVQQGKLRRR